MCGSIDGTVARPGKHHGHAWRARRRQRVHYREYGRTGGISLVGGLLEDRFDHLTDQIVDGVGEITNIVAGRIKSNLVNTQWSFRHVTVPSVIVGRNYQIAYVRGLKYLAVLFEHADSETLLLEDRLLQVAISVIRLGG